MPATNQEIREIQSAVLNESAPEGQNITTDAMRRVFDALLKSYTAKLLDADLLVTYKQTK